MRCARPFMAPDGVDHPYFSAARRRRSSQFLTNDRRIRAICLLRLSLRPNFCRAPGCFPTAGGRDRLRTELARMLREYFTDRMLGFDSQAAPTYAGITSSAGPLAGRSEFAMRGSPQLRAAITRLVATRDTRDFEHCGVALVNPRGQRS
jgi:hypothetical protein